MFMYSNLILVCLVLLVVIMYWKQCGTKLHDVNVPSLTETFVDNTNLSGADLVAQKVSTALTDTTDKYGNINLNYKSNIIADPRTEIVQKSDDSRECAIYSIPADEARAASCDSGYFNLSYYLLDKYINATSAVSSDLSTIALTTAIKDEIQRVKSSRDNDTSGVPCKISFMNSGWTMPTTRNGIVYPVVDSVTGKAVSIGKDAQWPQCYKLATDDNNAKSIATLFESNLSKNGNSLVLATSTSKSPYNDAKKYAEVSFKTTNVFDITDDMICSITIAPVISKAMKFLQITVDIQDIITNISFVQYDPSKIPHITPLTNANDIQTIKRNMYVYAADNASLLMLPMIFADSRLYQLEIDKCSRVSKASILYTTNAPNTTSGVKIPFSTFQHLQFGAGRSKRIYYSPNNTSDIQTIADTLMKGDFSSSQVLATCITTIDKNISDDFKNAIGKKLNNAFNTYGASSSLKDLKTNKNGVFFVSIGNDLIPTEADITTTTLATPPVKVVNGVVSCVSDTDAQDRGYMNADMLAREMCTLNKYKGWGTSSSAECNDPVSNKYTCANAFTLSNGVTEPITNDTAQHRNYLDAESAAKEICATATYTSVNGVKNYTDASVNSDSTYNCMKSPGDVTTYVGQDIENPKSSTKYYVKPDASLQQYTADGADYYLDNGTKFTTVNQKYASSVFDNSIYSSDFKDVPSGGKLLEYITKFTSASSTNIFFKDPKTNAIYYFTNNGTSITKKITLSDKSIKYYSSLYNTTVTTLPRYYSSSLALIPSSSKVFDIYNITGVYQLPWNDNNLITLSVNENAPISKLGAFTYSTFFMRDIFGLQGLAETLPDAFKIRFQENNSTITQFTWDFENDRFVCTYLTNNLQQHPGRGNFQYLTKYNINTTQLFLYPGVNKEFWNNIYKVPTDISKKTYKHYIIGLDGGDVAQYMPGDTFKLFYWYKITELPFYYYNVLYAMSKQDTDKYDLLDLNGTYTNTYSNQNPGKKLAVGTISNFDPAQPFTATGIINNGVGGSGTIRITHFGYPSIHVHCRELGITAVWNYKTRTLNWNNCTTWRKISETHTDPYWWPALCPGVTVQPF